MIFDLLSSDFNIVDFLIQAMVLIIIVGAVLPLHELAHGWVANKLGDPTAKMLGRLTLNPMKHIDPMGALMLFFVGFGWAKPVPVYPGNFKIKNEKLGMAIVAAAGPVSNLLVALLGTGILKICTVFITNYEIWLIVAQILIFFISVNITLGLFNLIPIPPLDGSKILFCFLPDKIIYQIEKYSNYSFLIILVLLRFTPVGDLLGMAAGGTLDAFLSLFKII